MAATFRRLPTRLDQLRADQAAQLRDALRPFEGEMPSAVRELRAHIDRQTAARNGWTFVMISAEQNDAVVNYLAEHSARPLIALKLWSLCFKHLDRDTGEIVLTRDHIAELLGVTADHVSGIMGELVKAEAIITRRERVNGTRGPGRVRYFMNPLVGTHLTGGERDAAQAAAPAGPLLTLMQGSKP